MEERTYEELSMSGSSSLAPCRSTVTTTQPEVAAESEPEDDFLSHTQRILTENFASIVETLVQKSVAGSLPHTKYLFEIGGVKEGLRNQIQNNDNGEPSLAELVLAVVKKHCGAAQPVTVKGAETVETPGATGYQQRGNPDLPVSNCGAKGQ